MLEKQGELGTLALLDIEQEQCGNRNSLTRVRGRPVILKKEVSSGNRVLVLPGSVLEQQRGVLVQPADRRRQFQLLAGYAHTVHKAQSLSVHSGVLHDIDSWDQGLQHTGVSRVTSFQGLYLMDSCSKLTSLRAGTKGGGSGTAELKLSVNTCRPSIGRSHNLICLVRYLYFQRQSLNL